MSQGLSVEFQAVQKTFGALVVLENLNQVVAPGEFIAIVGRSGCGKSTLLKLLAGLMPSTEGQVLIGGHQVTGPDPELRYLFQEPRLLPWKRVIDNVRLGVPNRDKTLAQTSLEAVGLGDRSQSWPEVLSGGQKQRVALARALAGIPRVLLLDEPLGALDALTRIEMQRMIEDLWVAQGFTVLLVTHDVPEAVTLADRVWLMEDGGVSLDLRIGLDRPRIRNTDFLYYEHILLDRLLTRVLSPSPAPVF
jgi:sulfonate transport system ATP-binding protein